MIDAIRALPRRMRIGILLAIVTLARPRRCGCSAIPQDPRFYDFADRRAVWGIPNFANVASNLAFLLVGLYGLVVLARAPMRLATRIAFVCFFAGVVLVSLGSSYFHLTPNDQTLFWDRLPMTVGFLSLLAAFVADRVDRRAGLVLLPCLIAYGAASLIYWRISDDLSAYFLAQAVAIVLVPLLCAMFPSEVTDGTYIAYTLVLYAMAIGFEFGDKHVDAWLGHALSGHTIKHLIAAAAALMPALMLRRAISSTARRGASASAPSRT